MRTKNNPAKAEVRREKDEGSGQGTSNIQRPTSNVEPVVSKLAVEPYIDKREVARRLGRTERAVEKLVRRGAIPYYKLDWRIAFRWSEIQAHLAETCRVCAAAHAANSQSQIADSQ